MHLIHLTCERFRGLSPINFEPARGMNVIQGRNAQGKTSLLESILYLATSKSHRTNSETELVQHGEESFRITGRVQRTDREVALETNWWKGQKRFKVNGVAQSKMSDLLGHVNVVFFAPEDTALVRGAASARRRFLDMELSQLYPLYLRALQEYRLLLKQRNELLRQHKPDAAMLDVWDVQLAKHGETIIRERTRFVDRLAALAADAYSKLAEDETMTLRYKPDIKSGAPYIDILGAARDKDLRHQVTERGPHRDDLDFAIETKSARRLASQGQQRTAALAVKLAEFEFIREHTGEYPLLMLDDALSELDAARSERLFTLLPDDAQCFLTTTDLAKLPDGATARMNRYTIKAGALLRD
jgi:DNA replication and repair protein RecF